MQAYQSVGSIQMAGQVPRPVHSARRARTI